MRIPECHLSNKPDTSWQEKKFKTHVLCLLEYISLHQGNIALTFWIHAKLEPNIKS